MAMEPVISVRMPRKNATMLVMTPALQPLMSALNIEEEALL